MRMELNKAEWGPFLERLSMFLSGPGAVGGKGSLFVVRPAVISAQIIGVTYDPKDNEVDVAFEAHDHLVHKPVQIFIDEAADGVTALEVVDADGTRHVLEPCTPLPVLAEAAKKGGS